MIKAALCARGAELYALFVRPSANKLSGAGFATLFAASAASVACLLAPGVALAGTLDQQQTDATGFQFQVSSTDSVAQTFAAGISGGIDQVDLNLSEANNTPTAELSVEIRNVSGGAPGSTVLAGQTVPVDVPTKSQAFVPVNFATPAPVVAGTQYAIVAHTTTDLSHDYTWHGASESSDSPLQIPFTASSPSGPWVVQSNPLAFKTYVVPSPAGGSPSGGSPSNGGPPPGDSSIIKAKLNKKKQTATFAFTATGATGFQCELIRPASKQHKAPKPAFSSCASPKTYEHLKPGPYTFEVQGVNSAGTGAPALKKFKI